MKVMLIGGPRSGDWFAPKETDALLVLTATEPQRWAVYRPGRDPTFWLYCGIIGNSDRLPDAPAGIFRVPAYGPPAPPPKWSDLVPVIDAMHTRAKVERWEPALSLPPEPVDPPGRPRRP